MHNIIVIGSGMIGSAMAIDLAGKHKVTVADKNREVLHKLKQKARNIVTQQLDVKDHDALQQLVRKHDLAINAVPGFLGFETLRSIIDSGINVVDIAFFPENALELDALAREKGVTAIVDCGVAPGMDNFILGYYNGLMKLNQFECLVGGLPKVRKWPFSYKAPFSPVDVIEEYTRPARYVENGMIVTKEPLSDCEFVEFEKTGTLEAFNSDGLRSILHTMSHIPNMKEKTLRYPGHVEYVKVLKESGFFSTAEIDVKGSGIKPLEFTSRILFNEWKLGDNEEEITVMRVTLKGETGEGVQEEVIYNLYDEYQVDTGTSSMARTTGYTATATANMVLEGLFAEKGVFPPELVGKHRSCFEYVLGYLEERDIRYEKQTRQL